MSTVNSGDAALFMNADDCVTSVTYGRPKHLCGLSTVADDVNGRIRRHCYVTQQTTNRPQHE